MQILPVLGAASPAGLPAPAALPLLLTTESLLFAAFGVSVALATPVEGGRPPIIATGLLSALIAGGIWLVGLGAASAWCSVYASPFPCDTSKLFQGVCLLGGILGQPVLATLIVWNIRPGA